MVKSLVCFYDEIGKAVVSYQIYNSFGDLLRSIATTAQDKSLPFANFPNDYSVTVVCELCGKTSSWDPDVPKFSYKFSEIIEASAGMSVNDNFNTDIFLENLKRICKGESLVEN